MKLLSALALLFIGPIRMQSFIITIIQWLNRAEELEL